MERGRQGSRVADQRTISSPEPISPPGRLAGYTTAGCLLIAGIAFTIAAVAALPCTRGCRVSPAYGGLALFVSVPVAIAGAAIARSVARRPLDVAGSSSWTWGLCFIFAAGVAVATTRFPSFTCSSGGHAEPALALCIADGGRRYAATSWGWLKWLVALTALALGASIMRWTRAVRLTVPVAVVAWVVGFGLLLTDTLVRGSGWPSTYGG
jgi:hypothetical protein